MGNIEQQFQECVQKNHIAAFANGPKLVQKELGTAESDLTEAREGIDRARWKWSTIQAYYSMFHTARALLFAKGFREHHHRCLRIAVAHLYAGEGDPFHRLIEDFQMAKQMRENADYSDDFSENGARKLVASAERFLALARNILARPPLT